MFSIPTVRNEVETDKEAGSNQTCTKNNLWYIVVSEIVYNYVKIQVCKKVKYPN